LDSGGEGEGGDLRLNEAQEALDKFESIEGTQTQFTRSVAQNVITRMFPSEGHKNEFYKFVAIQLYTEMHKAAKRYVKNYCSINDFRQVWSNPYLDGYKARELTRVSRFVPKVYRIMLVKKGEFELVVDKNALQRIVLVECEFTSAEAALKGADKLGFKDSNERALVLSKFSDESLDVLFSELKYIEEVKALSLYDEHRKQVEARASSVPISIRVKWMEELDKKRRLI
jgi:hypothetical protein